MNIEAKICREQAAAQYVGLARSTLQKMRVRGDGPRFLKLGPRSVGYAIADLDAWLDGRRRSSTSEKNAA